MSEDNKWQLLDKIGRKITLLMNINSSHGPKCICDMCFHVIEAKDLVNKLKSEMIKESRESTT